MTVLWAPERRDSTMRRFAERNGFTPTTTALLRWSVDRPRGLLAARSADFFELRAHTPHERVLGARARCPAREWFPGATAQLRRAHARRRRRRGRGRRALAVRASRVELTFHELREQVARARARAAAARAWARATASSPTCRTSPRRSSRSWRRASLGAIWAQRLARVRPAQRDRPLRADRAEGADRGRRLHAPRQAHRPPRGARGDPAGLPTLEHVSIGYADDATAGRTDASLATGFEPRAVRPPALRAVHARGTTGLPKPIVHGHGGILARALQEHGADLGHPAGRPAAAVHDDRLDDVERARQRAAAARLDRAARRRRGVAGARRSCGGWRRRPRPTHHRRQPGVPDGLPQGRACRSRAAATSRARSPPPARRSRPRATTTSTSSSAPTSCWSTAAAAPTSAARSSPAARCCRSYRGRDRRPLPRRRHRGVRPRRQRGRRRAGRARDPAADAVDAGALLGRRRTAAATAPRTSTCTRASGARATGCASREQGTCIITGRSDATLNRGGVRMGTSELYAVVEEMPEVADSLVVHLEDDERRRRASWCCSSSPTSTTSCAPRSPARCARSSRRATCPTRSPPFPAIPRTLTGKKLEAPVKRILRGAPRRRGRQPRRAGGPGRDRCLCGVRAGTVGVEPSEEEMR